MIQGKGQRSQMQMIGSKAALVSCLRQLQGLFSPCQRPGNEALNSPTRTQKVRCQLGLWFRPSLSLSLGECKELFLKDFYTFVMQRQGLNI